MYWRTHCPCPTSTEPRSSCRPRARARATGRVPRRATVVDDTSTSPTACVVRCNAGRGVSTVVARSVDGVHFETVGEVWRDDFGAESFERPVVLRTPTAAGASTSPARRRTASTGGSRRSTPTGRRTSPPGRRTVVLPGYDTVAVKDPVIVLDDRRLARLDLRAPADRGRSRGPDVARRTTAATTAWSGSGTAPCSRRAPAPGTRAAPASRRARPRPARRAVRRPAARGGQLARDHRGGPGVTPSDPARSPSRPTPSRCGRRTPTAPAATPPPWPCPTGRRATT